MKMKVKPTFSLFLRGDEVQAAGHGAFAVGPTNLRGLIILFSVLSRWVFLCWLSKTKWRHSWDLRLLTFGFDWSSLFRRTDWESSRISENVIILDGCSWRFQERLMMGQGRDDYMLVMTQDSMEVCSLWGLFWSLEWVHPINPRLVCLVNVFELYNWKK